VKYIDEFRSQGLIKKLTVRLKAVMPPREMNFMEVCGTHTQSFFRFGLDKCLPERVRLISGPGCPVCVSSPAYIDTAIALAADKAVIIATFGDMLRVPGSRRSLQEQRARGADVRVVYSPLEALQIAALNPAQKVIFLAVGFETTAPVIALTIKRAKKAQLKNIFFLSALKLIPAAMRFLLEDRRLKLDGFLCPGHVSAIIGMRPYEFIPREYALGCCIAGFEPVDLLEDIYRLILQTLRHQPAVQNEYKRVVARKGNPRALGLIREVFRTSDACWRGLGAIAQSGLELKSDFAEFDARKRFALGASWQVERPQAKPCRCAEILKGLLTPPECPLYKRRCTPERPCGPCMVSAEGACSVYYKYV
jgi:hydrogenase expression/formation protein HypD